MDREKVIKEYEDFVNSYISLTTSHYYEFEMHKAILAVLKEQEAEIENLKQTAQSMMEGICLLKEKNGCENCAIAIEDRQPVVRCKDCKHYRINTVYPGTNMIMKYCAKTGIAENNPDWFCADGIVKDTNVINK